MRGLAVLVCLFHLASVSFSQADTSGISTQFPFSSTLMIGSKAANGLYSIEFAAYRTSSGGSPVGNPLYVIGIPIKKGQYSVNLDFGPDVFNGEPVFVEVRYAKYATVGLAISPTRVRILTAPYSLVSLSASVADLATTSSFAAESLIASHATTADVAAVATGAIPFSGSAYEVVKVTENATVNGQNLLAAYATAKTLTPNGAALAATNRAAVILPPGHYELIGSSLLMDAEFVDLIGLSSNRDSQFIDGVIYSMDTGLLRQTANDVHIENLTVDSSRFPYSNGANSSDFAAYFPDSGSTATVVRNCRFLSDNSHGWSMRMGITYAGRFENCEGKWFAFGGRGTASGTFIECTGGDYSFGSEGTASGKFERCTSGNFSFGGSEFGGSRPGVASGTFTGCTCGERSFGANGTASGLFKDCTGGSASFGASGTAAGGRFYHCVGNGPTISFTLAGSPTVIYCVRNNAPYP